MAVILICALEPDERLVQLVDALAPREIVIVDDGSAAASASVFAAARERGATVLVHERNRGKGAALRTGIAHVRSRWPDASVITADCDGQHRPRDIAAVEAALEKTPEPHAIVLGERRFTGTVPLRSRIGNAVSRSAFALASGVGVADAQTGLRGLPASVLGWVAQVPGERFEHEQRVLLEAAGRGVPMQGVPIATVYLDGNASSHFRPVADSVRVLAPLVAPIARFAALGLVCFALDAALVVLLAASLGLAGIAAIAAVPLAALLARGASASVHFFAGRRWVFPSPGSLREHARRYTALAAVAAGAELLVAKLAIDGALTVATYLAQRFGVFRTGRRATGAPQTTRTPRATPASQTTTTTRSIA